MSVSDAQNKTRVRLWLRCLISVSLLMFSYQVVAYDYVYKKGDIPHPYLGTDRDGNEVNLSEFKGKLVVVTFWASWCGYCLKELPILENIQNHLGKDQMRVIAVNSKESRQTYRKLKKVLKSLNLTITHDLSGEISDIYGVRGIPHLLIINREGQVVLQKRGYGESSIDDFVRVINDNY